MKQLICLLLLAALALCSLCACTDDAEQGNQTNSEQPTGTAAGETTAATTAAFTVPAGFETDSNGNVKLPGVPLG